MRLEGLQISESSSLPAMARRVMNGLRPWQLAALISLVYLASVLAANGGDPMAFVRIGTRFDPGLADGTMGYDGQFAWQIARDPTGGWRHLDKPAYRYQRILYPLVARVLSLGNEAALPWMLILLNWAALVWGTRATEELLQQYGVSRWYALAFGLNVGMLMAVRLDLTEPLAFALFQLGALYVAREQWARSAVFFGAAVLAKEVILVLAAGYGLALLLRKEFRRATLWGAAVVGPFLLWQFVLLQWLGDVGVDSGGALATPFEWIPLKGWWNLYEFSPFWFVTMSLLLVPLVILPALAGLFLAVQDLIAGRYHPTALALLFQSTVFLTLPSSNILDPLGVSRFVIGLIAALLAHGAYHRSRRTLLYTQFWIVTVIFLIGDSFLPAG